MQSEEGGGGGGSDTTEKMLMFARSSCTTEGLQSLSPTTATTDSNETKTQDFSPIYKLEIKRY